MQPVPDNWQWRDGPIAPSRAIVFDMDGVLSNAGDRQHYLDGVFPDWDGFFQACGEDGVIDEVAKLLSLLEPTLTVILLTARPIRVQPQTLAWLERHGLRWDLLIMREFGDYMSSKKFKQRTVHEMQSYGFELELAFEDDQRNVDMFHKNSVPCIYIHSGYYD